MLIYFINYFFKLEIDFFLLIFQYVVKEGSKEKPMYILASRREEQINKDKDVIISASKNSDAPGHDNGMLPILLFCILLQPLDWPRIKFMIPCDDMLAMFFFILRNL